MPGRLALAAFQEILPSPEVSPSLSAQTPDTADHAVVHMQRRLQNTQSALVNVAALVVLDIAQRSCAQHLRACWILHVLLVYRPCPP
jgi:hypothetical protein